MIIIVLSCVTGIVIVAFGAYLCYHNMASTDQKNADKAAADERARLCVPHQALVPFFLHAEWTDLTVFATGSREVRLKPIQKRGFRGGIIYYPELKRNIGSSDGISWNYLLFSMKMIKYISMKIN